MEDKSSSQNYGFKNNVSTLNNTTSNFNYIKDIQDSTYDNTIESPLDINLENATSTTINTNTNNQIVLRQQPLKTIIQKIKTNTQVNTGATSGLNTTTTTINNNKHKVQTSVSGITNVNNTSFQKPNTKSRSKKQNHYNQIKYKLPSVLTALSTSSDKENVVIAGRDVLKVLQVSEFEIQEKYNLRLGARQNLNLSINDVQWCPHIKNIIATGSGNGAILIWDLNKLPQQAIDRTLNEHTRSVNRICFHPTDPLLLSGSQDGYMKLWDLRMRGSAQTIFNGNSESVRDVQFSTADPFYFAAAFENGIVQKWSLRMTNTYEKKINAHTGFALTVDWSYDGKYLATGGRDKLIKVWDMQFNNRKPVSVVQTMCPVSRVKWRPNHPKQLASCSLSNNNSINVWDLSRPYIATSILDGHKNDVTGIQWSDSDILFSCSKDKTLIRNDIRSGYQLLNLMNTCCSAWNLESDIAFAIEERSQKNINIAEDTSRSQSISKKLNRKSGGIDTRIPTEDDVQINTIQQYTNKQAVGVANTGTFNKNTFILLAKNYSINNHHIWNSCEHNAKVAEQVQQYRSAQTWRILKFLYGTKPLPPRNLSKLLNEKEQEQPLVGDCDINSEVNNWIEECLRDFVDESNDESNEEQKQSDDKVEEEEKTKKETNEENVEQQTPLTDPEENIVEVKSADYRYSNLFSQDEGDLILSNPIRMPFKKPSDASNKTNKNEIHKDFLIYECDYEPMVKELLEYYSEQSDVQMCVTILLVLRDKIQISNEASQHWFWSYIELLRRFKLWSIATDILSKCNIPVINQINQTSTVIYVSCNNCKKPILSSKNGYWFCDDCKKLTNTCSICHQIVKGLYTWCQCCGHGGHLKCYVKWFRFMNECPTGCGHNCLPSLGQMNVNSVNMNMPYNRNYYRESEPIHRPRGLSNAKNPNQNRVSINGLPDSYQQNRNINPVMNQQSQVMMKSNYIPGNQYNQNYEIVNNPYVNPKMSVRPYEGHENHSYVKQPYNIPHPHQGSISPVNRRYNSVIIDMDSSQLMNSYVNYVPHSLPENTQFFAEPGVIINKHSYHGMNHSSNSYKNSMPMVSERKVIHPVMMADPNIPYSPLIEYSAVNNTKGPSIIAANNMYDESIPNMFEKNSILGKAKSEIYHPVLNPSANLVKSNTVHGIVTNPLNNNDTSSYIENDSIIENENPNEISNDSSFNNGNGGGVLPSSSNYPEPNNNSTNNANINTNNNTNNNNLTVEPDNNRINLLSPSKTSIIKTLINSPSAAFSKLNPGGFKNKSNKNLNNNNTTNTGDNINSSSNDNNNTTKIGLKSSVSLLSKINDKELSGNDNTRKSPYLTRHHSAFNLNNLYSLNMTSTPDLAEATNSKNLKGKRRLRQSTSNGNLGNSKSFSSLNASLRMSSKNDNDNKKANAIKVKNVKKDIYYNRNDGIYGSL